MEFCLSAASAIQAGTLLHEDCCSQFRRHLLIQPNYNSTFLFTNICLETVKSLWMWGIRKQLQKFSCSVDLVITSQIPLQNSASPVIHLFTLVLLGSGKSLYDYFINWRKESRCYKQTKIEYRCYYFFSTIDLCATILVR